MALSVDFKKIVHQSGTLEQKYSESSINNGKGGISSQPVKASSYILNHCGSLIKSFISMWKWRPNVLKVFYFSIKINWKGNNKFFHELVSSLFYKISQETESIMIIARAWKKGRNGVLLYNGYNEDEKMKEFWKLMVIVGQQCECTYAYKLYI